MQIIVHTTDGKALFSSINTKIQNGELRTWETERDANSYVIYKHSPNQWSVLLKPYTHEAGLQIKTYWPENEEVNENGEGYIIGRFIEILMVHFRDHFSKLEVS